MLLGSAYHDGHRDEGGAEFHGCRRGARASLLHGRRPLFALPRPDGAGGWVPAPYAPASRRAPARDGGGEAVVPQAGLEPATGGL